MVLRPELISLPGFSWPIWASGDVKALYGAKTAFLCSSQCPGRVILKTFDVIAAWRDEGRIIAGGFHSPMEKECFQILLRGRQSIIWMPARSIAEMRLKPEISPAFQESRLLVLSPFEREQRRITAELATKRNLILATIADLVFVAHAAPGSRTLQLCKDLLQQNRPLLTIDDPANRPLLDMGAKPVTLHRSVASNVPEAL